MDSAVTARRTHVSSWPRSAHPVMWARASSGTCLPGQVHVGDYRHSVGAEHQRA
jgi:hypothetical protein